MMASETPCAFESLDAKALRCSGASGISNSLSSAASTKLCEAPAPHCSCCLRPQFVPGGTCDNVSDSCDVLGSDCAAILIQRRETRIS